MRSGERTSVGEVIWEKTTTPRNDALRFSVDHDYLLVYAADITRFRPNGLARSASSDAAYKNPDADPRGPWREDNYKSNKSAEERPNLYYPVVHPKTGKEVWPPRTSVWRYSQERHLQNVADGLVWWGKTGNYSLPKIKRFRSGVADTAVPRTLWRADEVDQTRRAKQHSKALFPDSSAFTTPKPERLLERVIHIGSDPGDIILDCFAGSGTTAAVAHKTGRRWITAEVVGETIDTFTYPRLAKVVAGEDPGGISGTTGWLGGGGFRRVDVGPSMYEQTPFGTLLSPAATNGDFSRAVAGQLGYDPVDAPPFCGQRGQMRLAVLDGAVGADEVRTIAPHLDAGERITIVAKTVLDDARAALEALPRGSQIHKAPRDVLAPAAQRMRRRLDRGSEL